MYSNYKPWLLLPTTSAATLPTCLPNSFSQPPALIFKSHFVQARQIIKRGGLLLLLLICYIFCIRKKQLSISFILKCSLYLTSTSLFCKILDCVCFQFYYSSNCFYVAIRYNNVNCLGIILCIEKFQIGYVCIRAVVLSTCLYYGCFFNCRLALIKRSYNQKRCIQSISIRLHYPMCPFVFKRSQYGVYLLESSLLPFLAGLTTTQLFACSV